MLGVMCVSLGNVRPLFSEVFACSCSSINRYCFVLHWNVQTRWKTSLLLRLRTPRKPVEWSGCGRGLHAVWSHIVLWKLHLMGVSFYLYTKLTCGWKTREDDSGTGVNRSLLCHLLNPFSFFGLIHNKSNVRRLLGIWYTKDKRSSNNKYKSHPDSSTFTVNYSHNIKKHSTL